MKKINHVVRIGLFALVTMSVSTVAFAGNSKFGPLPPPDLEEGPSALQFGPLPPPDLEEDPSTLQ